MSAKKVEEEILAWVRVELESEREKERQEMQEEASWEAEVKYLASDAFGLVKADWFWEGWEEFKELTSEQFPDVDLSSLRPRGTEPEGEEVGGIVETLTATPEGIDVVMGDANLEDQS